MSKYDPYEHLFNVPSEPVEHILKSLQLDYACFDQKVVCITGAARGIGKQTAIGLGSLGAHVCIIDKRESGQEVAGYINSTGGSAKFYRCDISFQDRLTDTLHAINSDYGAINILINNAVHFTIESFKELTLEEWDLHQNTNIRAMVITAKHVLPEMTKKGYGIILNMVALEGMAYAAPMSSSKVSMRSLIFSLSSEIEKEDGVYIMGFAPGLVATPLVRDVFPKYCERMGIDFERYVLDLKHNIGYEGLMPPEHCAAGLIYTLSTAEEYHGLIADPYLPLQKFGIIDPSKIKGGTKAKEFARRVSSNVTRLKEYISEVTQLNQKIESKIEKRTKDIVKEKNMVVRLMEEIKNKNRELESIQEELILAKDNAEQASMHKEIFLTNISHEIRTPLNAILGFIDLLYDSKLTAEQLEHIKAVQVSGENLLKLINEVLDISKIESGKLELNLEDFDLYHLLSEVKDTSTVRADANDNTLLLEIDENTPKFIHGDRVRLHQIFLNLIVNAAKFTNNGEIKISVQCLEEPKGQCLLQFNVSDTGVGIPPEEIDSIFESFRQVKGQNDRKYGGTGLGLAIVKRLVELHNGTLDISSTVDVGTCFEIKILFEKSTKDFVIKPQQNIVTSYALKGLNILLAEDNSFNQILETKVLEKLGAKVTIAENGKEVLNLIDGREFDLILMDVQMPEMDGMEATKVIRKELHMDIPIIALTANAIKHELEKCLDIGMNDYVTKPFKKEHLVQAIDKQLKIARPH